MNENSLYISWFQVSNYETTEMPSAYLCHQRRHLLMLVAMVNLVNDHNQWRISVATAVLDSHGCKMGFKKPSFFSQLDVTNRKQYGNMVCSGMEGKYYQ